MSKDQVVKGGFRRMARADQNLAEIQVGTAVYTHLDDKEDRLVETLIAAVRRAFANAPAQLVGLDRWEKLWRAADHDADHSVIELRDLAVETSGLLNSGAASA